MASVWQGTPYFGRYGRDLVSKPTISLKKRWGATVERLQSSALWACSVPLREHQASGARCEFEPGVYRLGSSSLADGNS